MYERAGLTPTLTLPLTPTLTFTPTLALPLALPLTLPLPLTRYERAGQFFERLNDPQRAMEAYRKGQAYGRHVT